MCLKKPDLIRAVDVCLSPHVTGLRLKPEWRVSYMFCPQAYHSFPLVGGTKLHIGSMVWTILNSEIVTEYSKVKETTTL